MCDTFVKYDSKRLFFGKNSDRSPNEPNLTIFSPAYHRDPSGLIQCTYRSVESQCKEARAMLLIKPSWIWGAEMGINDAGVIIGNEAVFTKSKGKRIPRLLGMDLLRLALEEAGSAISGVETIVHYMEMVGQGGNCGFDKAFYYDNSYVIADKKEAYILETSGIKWVAKKVDQVGNISNLLTLENDYSLTNSTGNHPFRSQHSEPIFTYFSRSKERQAQVCDRLQSADSVSAFLALLSSHQESDRKTLYTKGSVSSVCMHKSLLGDHTTASLLTESDDRLDTLWICGSSSPCVGLYLPVFFGLVHPPVFLDPNLSLAYWLEREILHRIIFSELIDVDHYLLRRHQLQATFIEKADELRRSSPSQDQCFAFSRECQKQEQAFIDEYKEWIDRVKADPTLLKSPWRKRTESLGKHPFALSLEERKAK